VVKQHVEETSFLKIQIGVQSGQIKT